ncbi:MAG: helix-turn-helix domain-containing protein [Dehalococcoidia bacterium]|nr:helix-turn-helix domain-containing protein [Dehalococcoidia bacterium]
MDDSGRLVKARARYVSALMQGESILARSVVDQAIGFGASRADIYLRILAPAQVRIGELWHEGVINVAQEHLATTITMEMMDFLRNGMERGPSLGVRAVVTPVEDDQHFIGARMVADFLAMDGWDVDFLGSGTPANDLAEFVRNRDADVLALSVTLPEFLPNVTAAVEAIRKLRPDSPRILLGGNALKHAGQDPDPLGCDAVAHNIPDALREARRLVGLTKRKLTLDEQLTLLGRRINAARTSRRMTQQELAQASGLERTYISMIENGRQNLTIEAALKIANALDIQPSDLLAQP